MCVLHRALRFTTRPGRPVGELLHSDVISEDSAKIAFSPYLQGGDDEAESNDIMHKGLDAGAVGFLSDSDNEEGDDAGPDGLGDQVEGNEQEGDGDESGHEKGHNREGQQEQQEQVDGNGEEGNEQVDGNGGQSGDQGGDLESGQDKEAVSQEGNKFTRTAD
ncbi:unnamed protein product [Ectocarpus sp. CCAP 1310/34]|nr:unnamed protein product [Ectocarpus sp. CCAP 1310/34]